MQPFKGYENVQVNNYGEKLKVGGHVCKVIDVKVEEYTTKDNKTFQKLRCKIDLCEPDEQAGYYEKKFKNDATKDAMNVKWKGFFDVSIPTDASEDIVKTLFKTFITSVEESNAGYDWQKAQWDEKTLIGKKFGGVFGLEELTLPDGKVIAFCRCRFSRSVDGLKDAGIPKVKLLDGTYKDYEEYMQERKNNNSNNSNQGDSFEETTTEQAGIIDDETLPF